MKLKNKLLSILTPVIVTGSVATFVVPLSSCTDSTKKEDKKYTTSKIKMSSVTNLKDINATDAPFCVLNTDTVHACSVQINIPDKNSTNAILNYQKGTFDVETNTITWDTDWTTIKPGESSTTITINQITYATPVRFYAYNTDNPGQFSTTVAKDANFNFQFFTTSSKMTPGKGIRLAGSLKSLLGTQKIEGETVTTVDDLNATNSKCAFCSLFDCYESPLGTSTICEISPGFLPFATMQQDCYKNLFKYNTNLLVAPDLPSKSLASECYYGMFSNCYSLGIAPYLPATILKDGCYSWMFFGCSSLTSISIAYPGTLLDNYFAYWLISAGAEGKCPPVIYYDGFDTTYSNERLEGEYSQHSYIPYYFKIVSKANTDPEWLNANTTVFEYKNDQDFGTPTVQITDYYPSKVRVYKTDIVSVVNSQRPRLNYIADKTKELGIYKKNETTNKPEKIDMESEEAASKPISTLPSVLYIRHIAEPDAEEPNCLNIVAQADSTITLNKKASGATGLMRFDRESKEWVEFNVNDTITLKKDEILKVYGDIKTTGTRGGNLEQVFTVTDYTNIKISGKVTLKGNIMSLLSDTKGTPATTLTRDFCFARLFEGSTGIVGIDSSFMPATSINLRKGCFYQMFKDCTSLTTPPALGWTTLADSCYCEMFSGCKALQTCPALPATTATDYCYRAMFYECEALTTPADIPFAQMKYWCCESMYMGCKNLTRPAIFNNGNQITEDESETYRGYSLNNTFRNCTGIKVCKEDQISGKTNPQLFFWCWDYNPGTGWGTGPEGIFAKTSGEYKCPYVWQEGGRGGGRWVADENAGISTSTKYYYYS